MSISLFLVLVLSNKTFAIIVCLQLTTTFPLYFQSIYSSVDNVLADKYSKILTLQLNIIKYLHWVFTVVYIYDLICSQVWFKNRRAKWRKQRREEQDRLRKMQHHLVEQPGVSNGLAAAVAAAAARGGDPMHLVHQHVQEEEEIEEDPDSSDLEVA